MQINGGSNKASTKKRCAVAEQKNRTHASLQSIYASTCKEWRPSLRISEASVNFKPTLARRRLCSSKLIFSFCLSAPVAQTRKTHVQKEGARNKRSLTRRLKLCHAKRLERRKGARALDLKGQCTQKCHFIHLLRTAVLIEALVAFSNPHKPPGVFHVVKCKT